VAVVVPSILGLFNTLGFVIGFFAIPTWLVAVLTDQKTGVRAIKGMLPAGMQSDFWAIMRILDRTFGAFVRGQVVVAIAVGVSTYIGLELLGRVATAAVPYPVVLAVIAGVLQLIPNIGPILSTL